MSTRFPKITAIIFGVLFGFLAVAYEGQIPALAPLPKYFKYLPEAKYTYLTDQRTDLLAKRAILKGRQEGIEARHAFSGSDGEKQLRHEASDLDLEIGSHVAASREFNALVAATEKDFRTSSAAEYVEARQKMKDNFTRELDLGGAQRYRPIDAPLVNEAGDSRNPDKYMKVIQQFDVENRVRYSPEISIVDGKHTTNTWCNVFVQDVTRAMRAELPQTSTYGMVAWLNDQHAKNDEKGWRKVGAGMAEKMACEGHPTIAIKPGHVMMVRPGSVGAKGGPAITQAGSEKSITDAGHFLDTKILWKAEQKLYEFWYHD